MCVYLTFEKNLSIEFLAAKGYYSIYLRLTALILICIIILLHVQAHPVSF